MDETYKGYKNWDTFTCIVELRNIEDNYDIIKRIAVNTRGGKDLSDFQLRGLIKSDFKYLSSINFNKVELDEIRDEMEEIAKENN